MRPLPQGEARVKATWGWTLPRGEDIASAGTWIAYSRYQPDDGVFLRSVDGDEFDPDGDDPPRPLAGQPTDRHNSRMCWSQDGKTLVFVSSK